MIDFHRREWLVACGVALTAGSAGCLSQIDRLAPDYQARSLKLRFGSASQTINNYELTGRIDTTGEGNEQEYLIFNNVTIIGYSAGGERLCSTRIGDVPANTEQPFRLTCPELPSEIVADAEESPCDPSTSFSKLVRTSDEADDAAYAISTVRCETTTGANQLHGRNESVQ